METRYEIREHFTMSETLRPRENRRPGETRPARIHLASPANQKTRGDLPAACLEVRKYTTWGMGCSGVNAATVRGLLRPRQETLLHLSRHVSETARKFAEYYDPERSWSVIRAGLRTMKNK